MVALMALTAFGATLPAVVFAQAQATLEVTAGRTRVTAGDRIEVMVVLRLAEAARPRLDDLQQQFGPDLDVLLIGLPEERALNNGLKEIRVRYELAGFIPGLYQIPAITIEFTGPDDSGGAVTSAPIAIVIESVLPPNTDTPDVRDLLPQIELPYREAVSTRTIVLVIVFIVAVALAAALAGWWLIERARRAGRVPVAAVAESPAEGRARAELDRISGLGLLEQGDIKMLHALLAECVRRYLSERFGFPAFALTTAELRARMEQQGISRWQARLVTGLLSECDAVQYAQYAPARARSESNISMAYEIIEMTREPAEQAVLTS